MFSPDQTVLLVIDVQGKLAQLVHEKEIVVKNIQAMIKGARILFCPAEYRRANDFNHLWPQQRLLP